VRHTYTYRYTYIYIYTTHIQHTPATNLVIIIQKTTLMLLVITSITVHFLFLFAVFTLNSALWRTIHQRGLKHDFTGLQIPAEETQIACACEQLTMGAQGERRIGRERERRLPFATEREE
jgi:sensor histidine kinase YesM